jgi:hypothetical protein
MLLKLQRSSRFGTPVGPDGTKRSHPDTLSTHMTTERPLLLVDIDGVLSLFAPPMRPGASPAERVVLGDGTWHQVEGIAHLLSPAAAAHLLALRSWFDLVWCSGWEERANDHLPHLLGLPVLPTLRFDRDVGGSVAPRAHWKLAAIDAYAGPDRPLAWVDDALDDACREWAAARPGPTLLVGTAPHTGLTETEAATLRGFAASLPA